MSSAPTSEEIARDARWLAQALDPTAGSVRLVAMDRGSYRAASFLDDRLMQQAVDAQVLPWPVVEQALAADMRTDARWIFHIGHVGSTLVSRLLGEIRNVLAVREPRILRDLALTPADARRRYLEAIPRLMSRTFEPDEVACVKATSFASEIAPELVRNGEHALLIYAAPQNYVASILAGENSVKELRALEPFRAERLAARGLALPSPRSDADRAAAAWACEMTSLEAAADAMTDRLLQWMDFDRMLAQMPAAIGRAATFFGFSADPDRLTAIATGPLMQRYSKDARFEYSPSLRQALIDQELKLQGPAIEEALAMLRRASEESALLSSALSRAEGI